MVSFSLREQIERYSFFVSLRKQIEIHGILLSVREQIERYSLCISLINALKSMPFNFLMYNAAGTGERNEV